MTRFVHIRPVRLSFPQNPRPHSIDAVCQFLENQPGKQGKGDDDKSVIGKSRGEFALQNCGNCPGCTTARAIVSADVFDETQAAPLVQAFQAGKRQKEGQACDPDYRKYRSRELSFS